MSEHDKWFLVVVILCASALSAGDWRAGLMALAMAVCAYVLMMRADR